MRFFNSVAVFTSSVGLTVSSSVINSPPPLSSCPDKVMSELQESGDKIFPDFDDTTRKVLNSDFSLCDRIYKTLHLNRVTHPTHWNDFRTEISNFISKNMDAADPSHGSDDKSAFVERFLKYIAEDAYSSKKNELLTLNSDDFNLWFTSMENRKDALEVLGLRTERKWNNNDEDGLKADVRLLTEEELKIWINMFETRTDGSGKPENVWSNLALSTNNSQKEQKSREDFAWYVRNELVPMHSNPLRQRKSKPR